MPTKNSTPAQKIIQFPPLGNERLSTVKAFITTMSAFMDASEDIEVSEVRILQVKTRRTDLATILKNVARNEGKRPADSKAEPVK